MRTYSYDYDHSLYPSQPVVDITIQASQNGKLTELTAIVDSGADLSIMPLRMLQQINARQTGDILVSGVLGKDALSPTYSLWVTIANLKLAVRVIGVEHDLIVMGRDVLNHLVVTLNGLATMTEILVND